MQITSQAKLDTKKRNVKLDLIRFLGVLVIMIAHAQPPQWLFQLRNFGTPLLIIGSALTYAYIYRNREIKLRNFFKKRFSRLIFPAWIFLSFFFLLFLLISFIIGTPYPFSALRIFRTYTFYSGIGYVWVFKIYIILALLTPIGIKWSKSKISDKKYFLSILVAYIFYELVLYPVLMETSSFIRKTVLVILPYSIIYFYGLRMYRLSKIKIIWVCVCSLLIFVFFAVIKYIECDFFVPTQEYKYPATLYYLSYASFCINLIYIIVNYYTSFKNIFFLKIVTWLSSNSLWIYLWHILGVFLFRFFFKEMNFYSIKDFKYFILSFIFITLFAILLTYIQSNLVIKAMNNSKFKKIKFLSYLK